MFQPRNLFSITTVAVICLLTACTSPQEEGPEAVSEQEEIHNEDETSALNENDMNAHPEEDANEDFLTLPKENLQKGDKSDSVIDLQKTLIEIGYDIDSTGEYDHKTIWAITDFQLQNDDLYVTGIYDAQTRAGLENTIIEESNVEPGSALTYKENQTLDEDTIELGNPYEVLALVNKNHALPADYEPEDLVVPNVRFPFEEDVPKKQMRKVAAEALEELFAAGDEAGIDLFAQSGYRSYDRQDSIFASNVSAYGEEEANKFSAKPGESEHQSGLSMDVTSPEINYQIGSDFEGTDESDWLKENAAEFGFIIRFPEGKEEITKYQYEPWHIRYVGITAAKEIMEQGITLEEYLED
ncbi:D-alanyl-D-alanine carboxypeptidase [Oceanobacillus limi]|uniref:D-alanyl-D-alanine carboxypeptidase n=1 Tax=Oceanobacillus limi TaxID=930131 RepID=A0A1I0AYA2_9BACI|nr:D-alanyl-D-alanine carboxypeptidase family protein [Oceanobacillus limi]SES99357.1 D-alanyl-D-alanine carboxypeptidase [Oceanobacillus limi]